MSAVSSCEKYNVPFSRKEYCVSFAADASSIVQ